MTAFPSPTASIELLLTSKSLLLCFPLQARAAAALQLEAEEKAHALMLQREVLTRELSMSKTELSDLAAARHEEKEAADRRCSVLEDEVMRLRERVEATLSSLALSERQQESLQAQGTEARSEAVSSMRRVVELEKELEITKATLAAGSGLGGAGVMVSRLLQQMGQPMPTKASALSFKP
jgi:hypothetical protein